MSYVNKKMGISNFGKLGFPCAILFIFTSPVRSTKEAFQNADWIWCEARPPTTNCPFSKNSYSIYFIESQKQDGVSPREACAIESAAILHPTRDVILLHTEKFVSLNRHTSALVEQNSNLELKFVNMTNLFIETPLQSWQERGQIELSHHRTEHLSDAVRYALLWKCGGIYLDTDAVSIRALNGLHNAMGFTAGNVSNGVMIFDRFHSFLREMMQELSENYLPAIFAAHGPHLISKVMRRVCGVSDFRTVINRPSECKDITIMDSPAFYPFKWNKFEELFKPSSESQIDLNHTYNVHLYGRMTRKILSAPGRNSLMENILKSNCPKTYQIMRDEYKQI